MIHATNAAPTANPHQNNNLTRSEANTELALRLEAATRAKRALRARLMPQVGADGPLIDGTSARAAASEDDEELGLPAAASAAPDEAVEHRAPDGGHERAGDGSAVEKRSLEQLLKVEQEEQERLVRESSEMATELRNRSLAARKAVKDDLQTLDSADEVLGSNQTQLDANNDELRAQVRAMSSSTCAVWLIVTLVCLMFVGTYVLMKAFPKPARFQR